MDIKTVLCPVDFSSVSTEELQLAGQLCERLRAKMIVHHNIEGAPPIYLANTWMYSETRVRPEEARESQMREVFGRLPATVNFEGRITHGDLEESILRLSQQLPADLIVMATHGPTSFQHASHTDHVLSHAHCPILTTRESATPPRFPTFSSDSTEIQAAVVPMDFSSHSLRALKYALALMDDLPLHLHLLHVEAPVALNDLRALVHNEHLEASRQHRRKESLERLKFLVPAKYQDRVTCEACLGPVVDEIVTYAADVHATLIFMGAHAKNPWSRMIFGAHSQETLHQSTCPVWLVPDALGREGASATCTSTTAKKYSMTE